MPHVHAPAQDQEHQHGTCAAELPGICDVKLVCRTMDDDISVSARSRGISKPEIPTQGASVGSLNVVVGSFDGSFALIS